MGVLFSEKLVSVFCQDPVNKIPDKFRDYPESKEELPDASKVFQYIEDC